MLAGGTQRRPTPGNRTPSICLYQQVISGIKGKGGYGKKERDNSGPTNTSKFHSDTGGGLACALWNQNHPLT